MTQENQSSGDRPPEDEAPIEGGLVEDVRDLEFHPGRYRAETAKGLAFLLVWILAISVALHYVFTGILQANNYAEAAESLSKIFNIWLPVISGLVGAAAAYYFTKEK